MIRHIVFLKSRLPEDSHEADSNIEEVKYQLELLPALIPELAFFEVNRVVKLDADSPDLVIISDFANINALLTYQHHPAHIAFMEWNRDKCPKLLSADYPIQNNEEQSHFRQTF